MQGKDFHGTFPQNTHLKICGKHHGSGLGCSISLWSRALGPIGTVLQCRGVPHSCLSSVTFVLGITTTPHCSSTAQAVVPTIFSLPSSLDIFLSFSDVSQLSVMGWLYHFQPNDHCPVSYRCCCCLVAKSCLTLCNPMVYSPPGSFVHGISQARILVWVATSSSTGSSQTRDRTCISPGR